MKRIIATILATSLLLVPHRASAPVQIGLGLALKCVAIGAIVPTAIIIYKCDQNFYLVRYEPDGEDPSWDVSTANPNTLKKLNGRRCEGPWASPDEPKARAWANNMLPSNPPFPCGPLGSIPMPNTNALRTVLQMSANGGENWVNVASATADMNDNLSFVVFLNSNGTNGMSREQLRQVADCDVAVTNSMASTSAIFRFKYEDGDAPKSEVESGERK